MAEVSDPRQTEQRLRCWLNSNQPMREQMCLALLPLLGPFTNCRPRRPKGGPDRARDIEAVYDNSIKVWASVGFKNDASNSDAHRKWARGKFRADLDSALEENPQLEGFVFLTNVDLTPTNKESSIQAAIAKGLKLVEVYDFELLRYHLDSPEGLIVRLQYLGLPMTPTEQAALVNRYGSQLQQAIVRGFGSVEQALERVEFLIGCQLPLREVYLELTLNTRVTICDFPNAAGLLRIDSKYQDQDSFAYLCQVNPEYPHKKSFSTVSLFWTSSNPLEFLQCGRAIFGSPAWHFSGSFHVKQSHGLVPVSLGDFISDGNLMVLCTPCLRDHVTHVRLAANGFIVFDMPAPTEEHWLYRYKLEWPDGTAEELAGRDWISLTRSPGSFDVFQDTLARER